MKPWVRSWATPAPGWAAANVVETSSAAIAANSRCIANPIPGGKIARIIAQAWGKARACGRAAMLGAADVAPIRGLLFLLVDDGLVGPVRRRLHARRCLALRAFGRRTAGFGLQRAGVALRLGLSLRRG